MYYAGEGTDTDKPEAYKWFYIAGELGNDDARDNSLVVKKSLASVRNKTSQEAGPFSGLKNSKTETSIL